MVYATARGDVSYTRIKLMEDYIAIFRNHVALHLEKYYTS